MPRGPKYAWLVGDFATFRPARARCQVCGREWNVDLRPFPLHTRMVDLEPKLRCTSCGSKGCNYFTGENPGLAPVS